MLPPPSQLFTQAYRKDTTFLNYDGVPWNNNNAEHAIKAFAGLRDVIAGSSTEKGTDEYLTQIHDLPLKIAKSR